MTSVYMACSQRIRSTIVGKGIVMYETKSLNVEEIYYSYSSSFYTLMDEPRVNNYHQIKNETISDVRDPTTKPKIMIITV